MANKLISDLNAGTRPKRGDLLEMQQTIGGVQASTKVNLTQIHFPQSDIPPDAASAHAMDDEFDGAVLDTTTKWTWVNQGALTFDLVGSMLHVNCDSTGVDALRQVLQPVPASANWRLTTKLTSLTPPPVNNAAAGPDFLSQLKWAGLSVRQISGNKSDIIWFTTDGGKLRIYAQRMLVNSATVTTHYFDGVLQLPWYWLRMEKNGANFIYYASVDGILFHQFGVEALASHVTTADQVGLAFNVKNGLRAHMLVDYFRVEALP